LLDVALAQGFDWEKSKGKFHHSHRAHSWHSWARMLEEGKDRRFHTHQRHSWRNWARMGATEAVLELSWQGKEPSVVHRTCR
jgi:hypothetical protein